MLIIGSVPWRKLGKILKNGFLLLLRESKMKPFQSKIWYSKFSFSSFAKYAIFTKIQKKTCFILFIDVWPLCCQWYIVIVPFLQSYTHYCEGTLNQNCLVYRKFKWQKLPFGGSPQIFYQSFR